jgi:hypothetical protein
MWTVNKHTGLRKRVQCHLPQCAWKGESLQQWLVHRRTLSKQSLQGQVTVKLTPEICINNASSNSRLTAVGRQATAANSHSQNCFQTLFFSFLSPYLWWDNNRTTPACWKTYWNCIAFELGKICGSFFVLCSSVLFYFFPLMRQLQNNIWGTYSRIGGWGMNNKIIKTETLLYLNLEILKNLYYLFIFFIYIHFIIYLFLFLFFIFNLLSL